MNLCDYETRWYWSRIRFVRGTILYWEWKSSCHWSIHSSTAWPTLASYSEAPHKKRTYCVLLVGQSVLSISHWVIKNCRTFSVLARYRPSKRRSVGPKLYPVSRWFPLIRYIWAAHGCASVIRICVCVLWAHCYLLRTRKTMTKNQKHPSWIYYWFYLFREERNCCYSHFQYRRQAMCRLPDLLRGWY